MSTRPPSRLVIGTRGSPLARWQADHIAAALRALQPGLAVEQEIIVTTGDRFQSGPLIEVGGKAVWVKEIESALLDKRVDLAVHSLKDVPTDLAEGLILGCIPPRADARDAWISRTGVGWGRLPAGARVGTSSPRRHCQLAALRPDLRIEVLRGNVDTRLRKVADGVVDAAVLACAGLDRLGLGDRITERLDPVHMLPAIGQGALAIEVRAEDAAVLELCRQLGDAEAEAEIAAERALLAGLGGSCRTPIGGHARVRAGSLTLTGLVGRPDGSQLVRAEAVGSSSDARGLGARVARLLLDAGADRMLSELTEPH